MTPEVLSGEQVRTILHVSKRKASWLLQNGYIRCADSGKKTRRFSILREDLDDFVRQSREHPERFRTPPGAFTACKSARTNKVPVFPKALPEDFRPWLEDRWARVPDLLTLPAAAELIGYSTETLNRRAKAGALRTVNVQYETVIAKAWLIDFLCTDSYAIRSFSDKHRRLLLRFFDGVR